MLHEIVMFGSAYTIHVNARNKSPKKRGKAAIINEKGDETNGYKVYIPKDKVVEVAQHARSIEILSDKQNGQFKSYFDRVGRQ